MSISRDGLLRSLERQRLELSESIVLTPVDSLPFSLADRRDTAFLHGLYLTDKVRDREASKNALIKFGGREAATDDIADIHSYLAERLGATEASLRLLAGLQAHTATFMSVSAIGQTAMLLPEVAGGHFSTHAILHRLGLRTVEMPVDYERMCIDRDATLALVEDVQPDFVFVDRSEGLRYEDFSFVGALEGPTTIFDASQYLAQILTGSYANPLSWGFDLMLFTLHKSFPGPQKAGIVSRDGGEVWSRLMTGLGTLVSSSHAENTYLFGLALLREEWLAAYARRLVDTAAELEQRLALLGVDVVERSAQGEADWPGTHHVWIRAPDRDEAFARYESLSAANVQVNYRKLPYRLGHGLRLGTTFSAVAGLESQHVPELASIVATAIEDGPSPELRERVRELAAAATATAILPPADWA